MIGINWGPTLTFQISLLCFCSTIKLYTCTLCQCYEYIYSVLLSYWLCPNATLCWLPRKKLCSVFTQYMGALWFVYGMNGNLSVIWENHWPYINCRLSCSTYKNTSYNTIILYNIRHRQNIELQHHRQLAI